MNDALWPNPAVIQHHYDKDWTRHPVYILDRQERHPLYNRAPARQRASGPSALYQAIARQRQYPDQYGSLPYHRGAPSPTQVRQPLRRAIGRCRVTYPHPPRPSHTRSDTGPASDAVESYRGNRTSGPAPDIPVPTESVTAERPPRQTRPRPTAAAPVREPETVSLLHPTGKFAEKVAAVQRVREWDEKIPQEHLPTHRPAWRLLHRFVPWLTIVKRCKECEQSWPCHPLRANLTRRYGGDITTRLHALSTKKLRTQTNRRSPTATRHRAWTTRTWYGKPKPD